MVGVKYKRADEVEERGRQTNKITKCWPCSTGPQVRPESSMLCDLLSFTKIRSDLSMGTVRER